MFKPYYGQCEDCPRETKSFIVINKPHLCNYHNRLRKAKEALKKVVKAKVFRKATGEKEVFEKIWEGREHKCFVCGVNINEPLPINFSHILSKGAYPKFRLNPDNIVIKCAGCHRRYEFGDISHSRWDKIKEMKLSLKFQYYNS